MVPAAASIVGELHTPPPVQPLGTTLNVFCSAPVTRLIWSICPWVSGQSPKEETPMYTLLPNTAGESQRKVFGFPPTSYDHSTAPVAAFSAYSFELPPPMYMTDEAPPTGTSVVIVGVLAIPQSEGTQGPGGAVLPRFVCHTR